MAETPAHCIDVLLWIYGVLIILPGIGSDNAIQV
jgi:hypothetical protein